MIYYAGQAIPGNEQRAQTLNMGALSLATQDELVAGTLNVVLLASPELGRLDLRIPPYHLWPCQIASEEMIRDEVEGYSGWVIRVDGEPIIDHFLEVIAPIHLRTAMKRQNWPSFPVEVALYCGEGA